MRLIILGAGGFGRTVEDVAHQTGRFDEVLFLDDNSDGANIVGNCAEYEWFQTADTVFYPAFGNNALRLEWLYRLKAAGCKLPTIIHPTAYVSPMAQIEPGTILLPQAIVNTNCLVKTGCIINCGAIIDHGCVLAEGVHICLGAIVKAENHIPVCTKIEAGEIVQNRTYPL